MVQGEICGMPGVRIPDESMQKEAITGRCACT